MQLLRHVVGLVNEHGYQIVNVDTNVVAQLPKLNPHIDAIRTSLATSLGLPLDRVSVKAKTNEHVGPEGRGEAISAQAMLLLERG